MKHLIFFVILLSSGTLLSQTRSGNYGHPIYWFNRYKHEIPMINQIPPMPSVTIGSIIDAVTDPKQLI